MYAGNVFSLLASYSTSGTHRFGGNFFFVCVCVCARSFVCWYFLQNGEMKFKMETHFFFKGELTALKYHSNFLGGHIHIYVHAHTYINGNQHRSQ